MKRIVGGALAAMVAASAAAGPIVATDLGRVEGVLEGPALAFKGLPYAAPPVGANRWRPPAPAMGWSGVRDASRFGADCAQKPFPGDAAPLATTPAEDCLFLNVWAPALGKPDARLPVMVWIHGGGFVNGGSSPAVYSGANFARDGVIMVSFNYRLGRFGFFAHPALAAEGGGGNFAFMDQAAALAWVKRNIAAFGGDPANVTIFGESAGGVAVRVLMTSSIGAGLFQKAIIESGAGRDADPTLPSLEAAMTSGEIFTQSIGAQGDAVALRALPAAVIVGDLNMITMAAPGYSGPMIDGRTLTRTPWAVFKAGEQAKVPLIIGANSADGFGFPLPKPVQFAAFGPRAAEARALYDPMGAISPLDLATQLFADKIMVEPARAVARLARPRQSTWLYRFDYVAKSMTSQWRGAPHSSEIPYVMDTVTTRYGEALTPADQAVATLTHGYWTAFAKTGRPDGTGLAAWPSVAPGDDTVQRISGAGAAQTPDPIEARLDFMESLRPR